MRKKPPKRKRDEDWIPKKDLQKISRRLQKREDDLPVKTIRRSAPSPATPLLSPGDLLDTLTMAIKSGDTDPLVREMAKYALGDVVGLGLMSQAEFDATEELDQDENVVRESGRQRALEMIPSIVRAKMLSEIAPYFLAKKSTNSMGNREPPKRVTYKVPDNGRVVRENNE